MRIINNFGMTQIPVNKTQKEVKGNNRISETIKISKQNVLISALINFGAVNQNSIKPIDHHNTEVKNLYNEIRPDVIPDEYQTRAAKAILKGDSTIITAPTGTGKTLVAEFAIYNNYRKGKRTFYTTPLKALTNQKYNDLKKLYRDKNVGIMTGDIKENVTAPIIVMTTEIYTNMLKPNNTKENEQALSGLNTVIFDEFHYMNDIDRGNVWEKAIMYSPKDIQLIALSATVQNSTDIQKWMKTINPDKKVTLVNVPSRERHVPLKFYKFKNGKVTPLIKSKINLSKINKSEKAKDIIKEIRNVLEMKLSPDQDGKEVSPKLQMDITELLQKDDVDFLKKISGSNNMSIDTATISSGLKKYEIQIDTAEKFALKLTNATTEHSDTKNDTTFPLSPKNGADFESVAELCDHLGKSNKLPAIFFVFNRKDCEHLATEYSKNTEKPIQPSNIKQIETYIEEAEESGFLGAEFDAQAKENLKKGVAVHHSGLLPDYKKLVEKLFNEKLINIVFSTETLSAGINMPAKTTVLTTLSKPSNDEYGKFEIRNLQTNEFHQMAGRAGRRGIDEIGNVFVMINEPPKSDYNYEQIQQNELEKAKKLTTSNADEITSHLHMDCSLALDILSSNNPQENFERSINKSFLIINSNNPQEQKNKLQTELNSWKELFHQQSYLDANTDKLTLKGEIASKIRGANELMLSEIITNGDLLNLEPAELAAVVSSFAVKSNTSEQNKVAKNKNFKNLEIPLNQLEKTIDGINSKTESLLEENKRPLTVEVPQINKDIPEYVYEWGKMQEDAKTDWANIVKKMKEKQVISYEGDMFKTLTMTIDFLHQIASLANFAKSKSDTDEQKQNYEKLNFTAKEAIKLITKPPVSYKK